MADEGQGAVLLLGSAGLFAAAVGSARWSHAPGWAQVLVGTPVVGVMPMLLLAGNILPFAVALVCGFAAVAGLVATAVSATRQ